MRKRRARRPKMPSGTARPDAGNRGSALAELGRALAETLDPSVVARRTVESVRVLLGTRNAALYRIRDDGTLDSIAFSGEAPADEPQQLVFTPGTGAIGVAIRTRRPFATPNVLADRRLRLTPEMRARIDRLGYRSVLVVPLIAKDVVIGGLSVGDLEGRRFAPDEIHLMATFASAAALALDNAQLFEEAEARRREAELTAELAQAIGGSLDGDTVLYRVAHAVRELLACDVAAIAPRLEGTDDAEIRYREGSRWPDQTPTRIEAGRGLGGRALVEARPFRTDDYAVDPSLSKDYAEHVAGDGLRSALVVPIMADARVEGLIYAGRRARRPFTARDEEILTRLAGAAATAMKNARLFDAVRVSERGYRSLFEKATDPIATLALDGTLTSVNPALERALGYSANELLGHHFSEFTHPVSVALVEERQKRARAGEKVPPTVELVGIRRDGTELVTEGSMSAMRDARGAVTGWLAIYRDVTERVRTDSALRASEERYRLLVEGSLQGIHIHRDWVTLFANTAFARMLGYADPRELVGMDSRRWIAPHAVTRLEGFNAARHRGDAAPDEYEFQAIRRDGTPVWVQVMPSLIEWEDGPAIQSTIIDVTARREGESALRASELRYRQLVEGSLQGMYVHRDFVVLLTNTALARIFGYDSARELTGHDVREFFPPHERARVEAYASARMRGEPAPARFELEGVRRDGTRISLEVAAERLIWDDAPAIQVTLVDITERKRAEALVRESAEFNRQVVSSAGEGIVVYDRELRYLLWNPFMEQLTGLRAADVLGRPALELFPHLREQGVEALLARALAGETVASPDVPYHVPSTGRNGWVAGRYGPLLDAHGQVVGVIGMVSDASEKKRAEARLAQKEAELRQSQKMDAVGRLAGGVAHDFNNLLTVIAGRAELLLRRLPPDEPMSRDIELIRKTSERASTLTRQLLAFSRKQVLQPKILDLNAIVAAIAQMLERLIGENIELQTSLDPALGLVKADPSQIEQILLNLAVNARDAMPRGGRLAIRTANVRLDAAFVRDHPGSVAGPHVLFEVSDNGIGISESDLQHLFEPFFTTKGVGQGTGLGLAMVYGIVKQHSGWIGAESEPGCGATFRIYLPRVEARTPDGEPGGSVEGAPRSSGTVLLVEDEPDVRALAREVLEAAGYTVLEAGSPEAALVACEHHPGRIHLLLTDVVMPHMTGYDLAARVARLRPETKRVYMSGYSEDALRLHGTVDPGARLLQKPFTTDLLTRIVYQVLHEGGRG